jgi:hypothetical protein
MGTDGLIQINGPERAVHPTPAITPLRLPPATTKSAPFLECHVGAVVGACAGVLAEATSEFQWVDAQNEESDR